jgi:type VI secretion system protein
MAGAIGWLKIMPHTRTLFERFRDTASDRGHSMDQEQSLLRTSILQNLERILNSRAGMSQACESYGIPDLTQIVNGVPERAREIERALEECIRTYEPRLAQVEVEHVPDAHGPMTACFKIRAAASTGKDAEDLWFETVVVSSGRVRLT